MKSYGSNAEAAWLVDTVCQEHGWAATLTPCWHQPHLSSSRHPQLQGTGHHSRGHVLSMKIIPPSCQQWLYRNPLQLHDHIIYERSLRRSRAVLSRWWIRVKWHKSIVTQNFSPANIHPSWERNKENVFKPSPCQFKITIFIMDHMDQSPVPDMTHNPSTTNLGFNKIFNNKIGNYQAEMNRKTLHVCIIWNIYYLAVTYCKRLSSGAWCPSDGVHILSIFQSHFSWTSPETWGNTTHPVTVQNY